MDRLSGMSFTAYVGLDWADAKHDVCIQAAHSLQREFACVAHSVIEIETWARGLYQRFGGPIAVVLELTKGPIVYALQKYEFLVLIPIHPATLAKYRETFHPSGAKDDPSDAELALDLVMRHPERFKPLRPQSSELRELLHLVEARRELVADKVRLSNRLGATLKQYYPHVLEWFGNPDTMLFCDFIERWPTMLQVKRARRATLVNFFRSHHSYRRDVMDQRIEAIRQAQPLTRDEAVIRSHSLKAQLLVCQLKVALDAIATCDTAIERLAPKHPDYEFFASLPGAGAALAPRLLVAFGEQRDRFASAAELQMYAGVAPVTERSGKSSWVHWRWQCPTFLRQTFVEWAAHSIHRSYWASRFYQRQRSKGSSHHAAVRALAFKWIRILYRCWQDRTRYDESKYLNALQRRGSTLIQDATPTG